MEKYSYQQWKNVSQQLNKTKEVLQQLSKLFIVTHQKVKFILRKCQTDLNYDPIPQTKQQMTFIKQILQKLADKNNDEYLSQIDPKVINKYQKHFQGLIELIRLTLMIQNNRNNIDPEQLKRIRERKDNKNEYSLRGQLKKSEQRMIRTKSGHRITKKRQNLKEPVNNQQYDTLFCDGEYGLTEEKGHIEELQQKRGLIEQMMKEHIQKSKDGLSINFKNKYLKLDSYLTERKQFADLFFCQNYFDAMIKQASTRKNQAKVIVKKDPDLNKIFPQFNIKTKYMKKQVKQNILQVIYQVKRQLLKEFHQANAAKMNQAAQSGAIKITYPAKKKSKSLHNKQATSQSQTNFNRMRFKSTNRLCPTNDISQRKNIFGRTMGSLRTTQPDMPYLQQQNQKVKQKFINRFQQNRFTDYHKNKIDKVGFINSS